MRVFDVWNVGSAGWQWGGEPREGGVRRRRRGLEGGVRRRGLEGGGGAGCCGRGGGDNTSAGSFNARRLARVV